MRPSLSLGLLPLSLLLLLSLSLLPSPVQCASYTVLIGWETLVDANGPAWYSLYFYPNALTVAYGDSVTWVWNSGEVHDLVFSNGTQLADSNPDGSLAPISGTVGNQTHFTDYSQTYSSGIRNKHAPPVTLTFIPNVGAGSFSFYCSIHSGMGGVITVLPAGAVAPLTPAQVNATVSALIGALEGDALAEIAAISAVAPTTGAGVTRVALPDGTSQYSVVMGATWMLAQGMAMYSRFLPGYLEVHVNDSVLFTTLGEDPHVVYFNQSNTFQYLYANWDPTQSAPLNTTLNRVTPAYNLNPQFTAAGVPITTVPLTNWPNPSGSYYSGIIFDESFAGVLPFPNSATVRFVTPGSFPYICPLHYDIGMVATIVVKAAGSALCTSPTNVSTCALLTAASPAVLGDPQFVGLRGQRFQVHGIDGAVYNLISTSAMQLNARFAFLTGPRACPTLRQRWSPSGRPQPILCWSHAGSYLSELGLSTPTSRLHIRAGDARSGFHSVLIDDLPLSSPPSPLTSPSDLRVVQHSTHHLTVSVGEWTLRVENSDGFVNIAGVDLATQLDRVQAHGLLGQTAQRREKGHFEGEVDDYMVAEGDVFGSGFVYNRFSGGGEGRKMVEGRQ